MHLVRGISWLGVSAIALLPALAAAQEVSSDETASSGEIVVTGTLIRGVAPVGTQSIAVGDEKIAEIGAVNTSDLIASVPQAGNFLGFVGVRGSSNFSLAVNRPSLRYLGSTSASGASTLLLLDGHRLPGMGIVQSSPDLDFLAAGAIERVEIVTDGGSSTYGSDAIGGVMNFITRKDFEGVEVKGSYGFADDYSAYNAGVTAGTRIGSISAYVSYDYSKHDSLYGRDRDWSQSLDWVNGVPSNTDCAVGNLRAGTTTYALPNLTAGLGNRCDNSELTTIYPEETKHSVFASLNVDNGGPVSFGVKGYYVNRKNTSDAGPLFIAGGATVRSTNPFAAPLLAQLPGAPTSATFNFNFSPVLGTVAPQVTEMESWGFAPTIRMDMGKGWQVNVLANYGVGNSEFLGQLLNATPITAAITAGTFNPFNLSAAGNAAAIAAALDQFQYGRARHEMTNARAVFDGPVFALPGGDVRVAIGVEYLHEKYAGNNSRSLSAAQLAALTDRTATRSVHSVFGELSVPVIGEGSGPIHSLTLSASGRYDDYSDFGHTFNPKLGVNLSPVEGLMLRGNWGKSFQAPGMSDVALAGAPTWTILPLSVRNFANPAVPTTPGRTVLLTLGGTISPLEPQKATTWSLGFDLRPTGLPGLTLGATYYNIDYKGVIGIPPIFQPATFYRDFPDNNVIFTAGEAAMQSYFNSLAVQGATNSAVTLSQLANGFAGVYGVLDGRTQNLARVKTSGIDFNFGYRHETGFGALSVDLAGTRILTFRQQSNPAAALVDTLSQNTTKLRLSAGLGAEVGNLRSRITWNHSQGYDIVPVASTLNQAKVGSYNVFNLFMQYQVPADSGIAKDLAFTLNVDNVFDKDPPLFRGSQSSLFGVANGFTLGRFVRLGVSKKF